MPQSEPICVIGTTCFHLPQHILGNILDVLSEKPIIIIMFIPLLIFASEIPPYGGISIQSNRVCAPRYIVAPLHVPTVLQHDFLTKYVDVAPDVYRQIFS